MKILALFNAMNYGLPKTSWAAMLQAIETAAIIEAETLGVAIRLEWLHTKGCATEKIAGAPLDHCDCVSVGVRIIEIGPAQ